MLDFSRITDAIRTICCVPHQCAPVHDSIAAVWSRELHSNWECIVLSPNNVKVDEHCSPTPEPIGVIVTFQTVPRIQSESDWIMTTSSHGAGGHNPLLRTPGWHSNWKCTVHFQSRASSEPSAPTGIQSRCVWIQNPTRFWLPSRPRLWPKFDRILASIWSKFDCSPTESTTTATLTGSRIWL